MLSWLFQSTKLTARSVVRTAILSHTYTFLWILRRCFTRKVRLYQLVPYAYSLSVATNIITVSVTYGCVASILGGTNRLSLGCVAAISLLGLRLRTGIQGFASLVGALILLAPSSISYSSRLMLAGLNWLSAYAAWQESQIWRAQFASKPFYVSNINEGSATVLRGTVHVTHLFLHQDEMWKEADMTSTIDAVTRALEWIVAQADRFETRVRFKQQIVWKSYVKKVPERLAEKDERDRFENWLNRTLKRQTKANRHGNSFVIVHVNQELEECLAYAVQRHLLTDTDDDKVEYTVVGPPHEDATYAHEILHLFGADDYYMAAYQRKEVVGRRSMLARSIMFAADVEFSELCVDDLTAQNVGWF